MTMVRLMLGTALTQSSDFTAFLWLAGGALCVAIHLVVHPLASLYAESLRVLRQMPILFLLPLGLMLLSEGCAIWWPAMATKGLEEGSINDWPAVLIPCFAEAIQRVSWSFHSVSQAGVLSMASPAVLAIAWYFVMKLPVSEHLLERKWPAVTVLTGWFILSLFGVAVLLGWRSPHAWQQSWVNAGLGGFSIAWFQVWFCRCIVEQESTERPALAAALETAKRWFAVSLLGMLNVPLVWLKQSDDPSVVPVRGWLLPELLCLWMFLPMMIASTRLPFLEAGGAAIILAKNILLKVLGLLISAAALFTLVIYAGNVISGGLHEHHQAIETLLKTAMLTLLQSWLTVSCALLLLRSGYLRPVAPRSF